MSWPVQVFLTKKHNYHHRDQPSRSHEGHNFKKAHYLMMIHPHAKDVRPRSRAKKLWPTWLCFS